MKVVGVCVVVLACFLGQSLGLPRPSSKGDDGDEYSPPDHVAGMPLERDGEVNTKVDAEMFLGANKGVVDSDDSPGTVKKLLTDTFHAADKNKDGFLGFWELRDWIHSKMEEHRKEAESDPDISFVEDFDMNKDELMSWEEYTTRLKDHVREIIRDSPSQRLGTDEDGRELSLEEEVEKSLEYTFMRDQKRFKYADQNGDGKLDSREYMYFVHPEYSKASLKALAEDLLKKLDKNDDKGLSEAEFLAYYSAMMEHQYNVDSKKSEVLMGRWRRTFRKVLDANGDGTADLTEFANFLDPTNEQHAMDEASYLLSQADANNDDKLSLNEILSLPDLFAGSSLTDSAYRIHWDEL
jgi:Ca2+-binding EF-hand superfamily protein